MNVSNALLFSSVRYDARIVPIAGKSITNSTLKIMNEVYVTSSR